VVSFRYHIVSVAAVLLALAAGVLLGAGPLSSRVSSALTEPTAKPTTGASGPNVAALRGRVTYDDAFAAAVARTLTAGKLKGQRVVVVVAPGTPAAVTKQTREALTGAGASISGEVDLAPAWSDPTRAAVLSGITDQLAPPDSAGQEGTPAQRAAGALAASVVTAKSAQVGKASDPATALLAALTQGGFLTTKGSPDEAARLAVVLMPVAGRSATGVAPLAAALSTAGSGTVVAAPTGSARPGASVTLIRGDGTAGPQVSTVDSADLTAGRVAVVLALAQQAAGGRGDYGTGPGADAPVPRP
jgi:hypothetical protein